LHPHFDVPEADLARAGVDSAVLRRVDAQGLKFNLKCFCIETIRCGERISEGDGSGIGLPFHATLQDCNFERVRR
jgi:hypothetical protein